MRFLREEMRLYAVTDRRWLGGRSLYDAVRDALDGGVTLVQLREKDLDPEAFKTTEAGKLLSDAALLRISLQRTQPDPLLPDFVEQYRDWLGDVVFTAAGKQQAFELSEDRD
ncbi:MAG: thiamine phosphate synthase [Eubacterium sp.]|nr:thiamine phosphate synthase [Eubacterium sp.]